MYPVCFSPNVSMLSSNVSSLSSNVSSFSSNVSRLSSNVFRLSSNVSRSSSYVSRLSSGICVVVFAYCIKNPVTCIILTTFYQDIYTLKYMIKFKRVSALKVSQLFFIENKLRCLDL